jgi:hypothetical protein
VPEAWSSTIAGLHVPLTPFADVVGNTGTVPPAHIVIDVPKLKLGTVLGVTVTLNVVGLAHDPAVGVNV